MQFERASAATRETQTLAQGVDGISGSAIDRGDMPLKPGGRRLMPGVGSRLLTWLSGYGPPSRFHRRACARSRVASSECRSFCRSLCLEPLSGSTQLIRSKCRKI